MDRHAQGRQSEEDHTPRTFHPLALCLLCLTGFLTLCVILASQNAIGSTNLLKNPGFESGTADWYPSSGTTFTTSTLHVHSGQWAASLNKGGTTGEIWTWQDVSVVPSAAYTVTGWVYEDDPNFDNACLRITWRGSTWLYSVEECLEGDYDFYRPITLASVIAPPDAVTARIMAVADIGAVDPSIPAYFDDLDLTSSVPPTPPPMGTPFYVPIVVKSYPSEP
ncbi:MAG: hypothetical protein GTO63_06885 [Anaerolineae bacterium]|nr:hypothetical protein [Anaerolineae bacterium]NIN94663.1 hypothetical protein [Anaerolineae bacterium]NIQ77729.1 hypothetical protein [Anaerolineae bacterium]